QLSDGAEVEVQIFTRDTEFCRDVDDRFLELHQRAADVFRLARRQRTRFHAADGLPFEQLADELDEREHQLRDRALDIVWIGVPPQRRRLAAGAFELAAQAVELRDLGDRQ